MILRRLMTHVRTQNWFAVGLDFLIVVVGVFIGFQVTAWNEDREVRKRESATHAHLIADFEAIRIVVEQGIERSYSQARNFTVVIETIDSGAIEPGREELFGTGLVSLPWTLPPPQTSSTLNELIGSGLFWQLSDDNLRRSLSSFLDRHALVSQQIGVITDALVATSLSVDIPVVIDVGSVAELEIGYESGNFVSLAAYNASPPVIDRITAYNIEAMRANPRIRRTYAHARTINLTKAEWLLSLLPEIDAVLDRLDALGTQSGES